MIARICVIAAGVMAVLAFFGLAVGDLTTTRELALGLGLVVVASLL